MDWDEYLEQRGLNAYLRARYGVGAYEYETFSQYDEETLADAEEYAKDPSIRQERKEEILRDILTTPLVSEEEEAEALNVLYSTTEACPMCGAVHPV